MSKSYCATLGMYDWPETRDAIDSLWQLLVVALRDAGLDIDATQTLDRDRAPMDIWLDPTLILGQTCGFPFIQHLAEKTRLLGTPDCTAPGCRAGHYVSWILARTDDPRNTLIEFAGSPVAINDLESQSGCNAFRLALSALVQGTHAGDAPFIQTAQSGFFSDVVLTGSHRKSLHAVASKRADVCAIDPVCLALAKEHDTDITRALKIIGKTPETPSLPLITALSTANLIDLHDLQLTLKKTMSCLPVELRQALHLDGLVLLEESQYRKIAALTDRAKQLDITDLCSPEN